MARLPEYPDSSLLLAFPLLSRHTIRRRSKGRSQRRMSELNTLVPKTDRRPPSFWRPPVPEEPQQRRMMVAALTLLLSLWDWCSTTIAIFGSRYSGRSGSRDKQPTSPTAASPSEIAAAHRRRAKSAALKTPSSPSIETIRTIRRHPWALRHRTVLPPLESRSSLETSTADSTQHQFVEVTMQRNRYPEQDPASAAVHNQPTHSAVTNNRLSVCRCLSIPPRSSASL
jgi:hypothetical protein